MKSDTKATLEVLIHQLEEVLQDAEKCTSTFNLATEINELLDSWIKTNDLHPENVQVFGPFQTSNGDSQFTVNLMEVKR